MEQKNKTVAYNRLSGKDKKLTVLFVGAGYGQISVKDNVARAMDHKRQFVGYRSLPTRLFCYKNGFFVGGVNR